MTSQEGEAKLNRRTRPLRCTWTKLNRSAEPLRCTKLKAKLDRSVPWSCRMMPGQISKSELNTAAYQELEIVPVADLKPKPLHGALPEMGPWPGMHNVQ